MKKPLTIAIATLVSGITVAAGLFGLGWLPAFLFTFGFVGGLVVWLLVDARPGFAAIRLPYYLSLGLFFLHKLEERYTDFFPALSEMTGAPMPSFYSWVSLVLLGSAALWLLIPILIKRGIDFGYYLAWTFFLSMGVTELAHFVFPFIKDGRFAYFPGMATVVFLAPLAWWGVARLRQSK